MITEQELNAQQPILVTLDAQDIGILYATKTSPDGFTQFLLSKLKENGGPVEGVLQLKLQHGRMLKIKESAQGPGFFDYMWLPDAWVAAINDAGGIYDAANPGGMRIH